MNIQIKDHTTINLPKYNQLQANLLRTQLYKHISDFKQITTGGAATATVTEEDWRAGTSVSARATVKSCMQNGIDR